MFVVPDKRAPGSALALSGASADPGPIATGRCCFNAMVDGFSSTMNAGGYGSRLKAGTTVDGVWHHTGSAMEYFTWLSAKLDSIEAMPSSRVSLFFRKAS
jgi:hypothetical protein